MQELAPTHEATQATLAVERLDRVTAAERLVGHEHLIDVEKISAAAAADASADAQLREWVYPEPPTGTGVCSRKMAPSPFDALAAAQRAVPGSDEVATLCRLRSLKAICAAVSEATGAQWCGIYQVIPATDDPKLREAGGEPGASNLLKLAYIGAPSRPYFPLTAEFAEGSNNSTVAMSGCAVVYHDVLALPSDAPYYTCDGQVRAEACVPIFGSGGSSEVIGIMDVEAFHPDVFRPARGLGVVLAACDQLSRTNILRPDESAAAPAAWEEHTCRLPARLSTGDKEALKQLVTMQERSAYFDMSCCPISHVAEQRMEQVSQVLPPRASPCLSAVCVLTWCALLPDQMRCGRMPRSTCVCHIALHT